MSEWPTVGTTAIGILVVEGPGEVSDSDWVEIKHTRWQGLVAWVTRRRHVRIYMKKSHDSPHDSKL